MNKEVIKANKECFDYWLDGGEVLGKNTMVADTWIKVDSDRHWDCIDIDDYKVSFVINDQYAEFRKALAEGKTIQWCFADDGWKDYPYFDNEVKHYRIKPDEPKFKVGNWIKYRDGTIEQLTHSGNFDNVYLWEPQPDEWCWFRTAKDSNVTFGQFIGYKDGDYYAKSHTSKSTYFKYCEPFEGTLPSGLKD